MGIDSRLPADVRLHRLRYDEQRTAAWRGLLSEAERARLDGYGVAKRRREFLLGRVAARQLVAHVRGCAPPAVPLVVAEGGAVEVAEGPASGNALDSNALDSNALHLSISHAAGEAAAAVARRAVGVDLERARPRPERLHRFLLAEEERPLLGRLPVPEASAFALCWALKEAVLKALRCGLRRSPKILRLAEVDAARGTARIIAENGRAFDARFSREGKRWLVVAYERGDAF